MLHCYFHVGWPKTGSSAIQSFCQRNRKTLATRHGILYPNFGAERLDEGDGTINHGHIAHAEQAQITQVLDHAVDYAQKRGYGKLLVSSESLHRAFCNAIATIAERPDITVTVICYLRRQDHLIEAAWKQWFLKSDFPTIDAFADDLIAQRPLKVGLFACKSILDRWTKTLGRDRFVLRVYEKPQLIGEDIIPDFCNAVGIENIGSFHFESNGNTNTGFNRDVLELAAMCKPLYADIHDPRLDDMLKTELTDAFQKEPFEHYELLSPAKRREIVEAFDEENQSIAREHFGREDGKLFREEWPDPNAPWTPYEPSLDKMIPIIMQILLKQHHRLNEVEKPMSRLHAWAARYIPMLFLPHVSFKHWLMGRYRPKRDLSIIRKSGLFDEEFYRRKNPDIASKGRDPLWHYVLYGWSEGRNPNADFNTAAYLLANPSVAKRGINPFVHYIESLSRTGKPVLPESMDTNDSDTP